MKSHGYNATPVAIPEVHQVPRVGSGLSAGGIFVREVHLVSHKPRKQKAQTRVKGTRNLDQTIKIKSKPGSWPKIRVHLHLDMRVHDLFKTSWHGYHGQPKLTAAGSFIQCPDTNGCIAMTTWWTAKARSQNPCVKQTQGSGLHDF